MITYTELDIAQILSIKPDRAFRFTGVEHDSRANLVGKLFVAIKGERADGHDFCQAAKDQGAAALLVAHAVNVDLPQIIVSDVIKALGKLAQAWLAHCGVKVCAITGSAGKTSVKNMTASILSAAFGAECVFATPGNFNSDIGLPLALCQLSPSQEYAVLEMGMNRFGEIDYLSRLAKPSVACINNVLPVHTAGVGGIEGVLKAKSEIFNGLRKDGIVIINHENRYSSDIKQRTAAFGQTVFGLSPDLDVYAKALHIGPRGTQFELCIQSEECVSVNLPFPGEHYVLNALASASCARALGASLSSIKAGLEGAVLEKHRMMFLTGPNGATIIDDCYNANFEAVLKSAEVLLSQAGEPVLVLGDMGEIGDDEQAVHAELGKRLKAMGLKTLLCCGRLTQFTAQAFGEGAQHFDSKAGLLETLPAYCHNNAVLLFKASRSQRFEELVDPLSS